MEEALSRELREEVGVTPTEYRLLTSIADPNAKLDDPITYHMYAVTAWQGGEPTILDAEHSELRWFKKAAALSLGDLALEEYVPLLANMTEIACGRDG